MPADTGLAARLAVLLMENANLKSRVTLLERQITATQGGPAGPLTYLSDNLATWNKSVDFLRDEKFMSAYRRGVGSGNQLGPNLGMEWRVAICCWAAVHALQLPGDLVECGTNTGTLSLAVCEYIDFNNTGKSFWLFDTFDGIPHEQLNDHERELHREFEKQGGLTFNAMYPECFELAQRNFAPFPKAKLVRGKVPDTLGSVDIERVSYLSIDMNIEYPERMALEHFWPKLSPGALVVLDDYNWLLHSDQKASHDAFAKRHGLAIFALPTGQGLLIKP